MINVTIIKTHFRLPHSYGVYENSRKGSIEVDACLEYVGNVRVRAGGEEEEERSSHWFPLFGHDRMCLRA